MNVDTLQPSWLFRWRAQSGFSFGRLIRGELICLLCLLTGYLLVFRLRPVGIFDYAQPEAFLSSKGVTALSLLFWGMGWFATWVLGLGFVMPFFHRRRVSPLISSLGAFCIGFPCALAVIRITSLLFPQGQVFFPTVGVLLGIGGIGIYLAPAEAQRNFRGTGLLSWLQLGVLLSLGTLFFLIVQVRTGNYSWVGHGPNQYAYYLGVLRRAKATHFPIISQHGDELLYQYFLIDFLPLDYDPIMPMWIGLALFKSLVARPVA